jgi:hypothetical protein
MVTRRKFLECHELQKKSSYKRRWQQLVLQETEKQCEIHGIYFEEM